MTDVLTYLTEKNMPLKRAGGWEMNTPCVFCHEKPEARGRLYINVDPEADIQGLFLCHLCGAKGNITTLKRHFGDNVERIEIDSALQSEILDESVAFYESELTDFPEVLEYLQGPKRGLSVETIKKYRLGYAPMRFEQIVGEGSKVTRPNGLYRYLRDAGYEPKDIIATGLCQEADGRLVDALGGMVSIPYLVSGHPVAIRGRTWPMTEEDFCHWQGETYKTPPGKYKTCAGTKARLFNTDAAWDTNTLVLCEGELDAIVLTEAGFPAVGVPGAGSWQDGWDDYLTHVRRALLVFDRDQAGEKAANKLVVRFGSKVRRIHLSAEGTKCDPTEWFQTHTSEEFQGLVNAACRTGLLVTVKEAVAEFESIQGTSGLKFNFELLDLMIDPGLQPAQLMILLAKTGCLTGDTEIAVNRCRKGFKMTIAQMYERWSGGRYAWDKTTPTLVQRADGDHVRLGEVDEVWYSGRKPVYALRTRAGRTIKATTEHPFLTPAGWKKLGELAVGDEVLVNAGRSARGREVKPQYRQRSNLVLHPHRMKRETPGTNQNCVVLHRLVAEAELNHLDLGSYLQRCRSGPIEGLTFLDPAIYAVHHIDRDSRNNEMSNLKVLSHSEHHALHAAEGTSGNVLEQVAPEIVASIEYVGEEDTYDISMKTEPHNFMANGFVVHNTGKTLMLLNLMHRMRMAPGQGHLRFLFVSLEQTRGEWWDRARRIHRFYNLESSEAEAERWWQDNLMIVDKNRLTEHDLHQVVEEYAEGMGQMPDVICLDYLGYFARSFKGEGYERSSMAAMALKGIGKEYRVPIIAPHQVNRGAREGEEFGADAARESGVIEETADFLFTVWSPDNQLARTEAEKTGHLDLRIAKSRHGGRGTQLGMQFAPVSLVMVPDGDPLHIRARQEFRWRNMYKDSWSKAVYRHRTGFEGKLDVVPDLDGHIDGIKPFVGQTTRYGDHLRTRNGSDR